MRTQAKQLIGLEALRFISAFAILVWHYQNFLFAGSTQVDLVVQRQPFFAVLRPFYQYGYSGVELFWCISGFIFAWKYAPVIRDNLISFRKFLLLRFSRLYPLHVATLFIVAVLNYLYLYEHGHFFVYVYNDLRHFVLNVLFASGWGLETDYSFNGPAWSISAEILVYLLFFLICRYAGTSLWLDVAITIAISVISLELRNITGFKSRVFGAATFFYLGCVSYHLYAMMLRSTSRKLQISIQAILTSVIIALGSLVELRVLRIAGASIVIFPAVVVLFQTAIRPQSQRVARALTVLGDLTYASYLMHFPIELAFVLAFGFCGIPLQTIFYGHLLFICYIVTTLGIARLVFVWFERPAQQYLRDRLSSRTAGRTEPELVLGR